MVVGSNGSLGCMFNGNSLNRQFENARRHILIDFVLGGDARLPFQNVENLDVRFRGISECHKLPPIDLVQVS